MQKTGSRQIFRTFAKYSALNILGMIGLSYYILADTFFIARGLGTNALAALNIAIPAYSFIHGLGLMVGMGGATRYSILKQNKDTKKTDEIFSQAFMFVFLLSLPIFFIGLFFSGQMATLFGANQSIQETTSIYLKIICMFAPIFMINGVLLCFVRNDGNPRLSMIAMLSGSFSNILLDYIFVFPLKMGMRGAALATGISPVVGMLILSLHFISKKNSFKFTNAKLKFKILKDISYLGAGTLVTQLSSGVVIMLFNIVVLKFSGNVGVAAYGIIANIAFVVTSMFIGLADGIQPIISSSYGRADKESLTKTYHYAIITAIIFAMVIYISSYIFARPIAELFNKEHNAELTRIAVEGIRLYFTAFIFVGINIITAAFFSATDNPKKAFTISILRGCMLIIPVTIFMSFFFGLRGVWLSLLITEFLTMIISIKLYVNAKSR